MTATRTKWGGPGRELGGLGGAPRERGERGGLNPVFLFLAQKPKNPIPPPARLSNPDARVRNPGINLWPGRQTSAERRSYRDLSI